MNNKNMTSTITQKNRYNEDTRQNEVIKQKEIT